MHVNIYTTRSEKIALNKVMVAGSKVELTGTLRNPSDILNPTIDIEADASVIAGKNYFEIPEFGRKYFITEVTSLSDKIVVLHGHVDVLATYADDIRTNSGIVGRSENNYHMYMNDNIIKVDSRPNINTLVFDNGGYFLKNPSIALVVVG